MNLNGSGELITNTGFFIFIICLIRYLKLLFFNEKIIP